MEIKGSGKGNNQQGELLVVRSSSFCDTLNIGIAEKEGVYRVEWHFHQWQILVALSGLPVAGVGVCC